MLLPDSAVFNAVLEWLAHGALALSWWQIVLFTLGVTHITMISVTVFLHRHQAHRALDLHPIASHFFRFWLWLTTSIRPTPCQEKRVYRLRSIQSSGVP